MTDASGLLGLVQTQGTNSTEYDPTSGTTVPIPFTGLTWTAPPAPTPPAPSQAAAPSAPAPGPDIATVWKPIIIYPQPTEEQKAFEAAQKAAEAAKEAEAARKAAAAEKEALDAAKAAAERAGTPAWESFLENLGNGTLDVLLFFMVTPSGYHQNQFTGRWELDDGA